MKCDKAAVSFSSKNRRITQEKRRFLGDSVYDFCDIPLFFEAEALKNLVHMLVVIGKLEGKLFLCTIENLYRLSHHLGANAVSG